MLALQRQLLAILCVVTIALVRSENSKQYPTLLDMENRINVLKLKLSESEDNVEHNPPNFDNGRRVRSFKDVRLRQAAEALTDEEITNIVKSITFPNEENITEDVERANQRQTSSTPAEDVEPRRLKVPIAGLRIVPSKRTANGAEDTRGIKKKIWSKYLRRLMRYIRKGTRKIKRKTRVKKLKEEPSLESFLKRMYLFNKQKQLKQLAKKKKIKTFAWFLW